MLRIDFSNGKIVALNVNFHRIAERGKAHDFNVSAIENAHFHQSLVDRRTFAANGFDGRALAGFELIESHENVYLIILKISEVILGIPARRHRLF